MNRRKALGILGAAIAPALGASGTACSTSGKSSGAPEKGSPEHPQQKEGQRMSASHGSRMPVVYLPHGGGPWPFVDFGLPKGDLDALAGYLRALPRELGVTPKAMLVVSAHWEEAVPTVMTSASPPIFYDYYGFPPESYAITWPAPGAPELAARVRELLRGAGIETAEDRSRGFDHGTFIPLKVTYPEAQIPTTQLSLKKGLDPAEHIAIGRALAPLRDEGVLIVGSGMSFHNMRDFRTGRGKSSSEVFDTWLQEAATAEPETRQARLRDWAKAPSARDAHPREEHLLPLMVIAGAAESDKGRVAYDGSFMGAKLSAFHYG